MSNNETVMRYNDLESIPLFLGCLEITKLLGLSRTTVYELFQSEDFPTITVGRRQMVRKDALLQWIDSHEKVIDENEAEQSITAHMYTEPF